MEWCWHEYQANVKLDTIHLIDLNLVPYALCSVLCVLDTLPLHRCQLLVNSNLHSIRIESSLCVWWIRAKIPVCQFTIGKKSFTNLVRPRYVGTPTKAPNFDSHHKMYRFSKCVFLSCFIFRTEKKNTIYYSLNFVTRIIFSVVY